MIPGRPEAAGEAPANDQEGGPATWRHRRGIPARGLPGLGAQSVDPDLTGTSVLARVPYWRPAVAP